MHQPQVVEGQVGGRVGRGKCRERALGPRSDMEGTSAALAFVLSTAPAHLLPLRMQGEEPTFPTSPAPRLQQAGLLLPLLHPLSPLLTMGFLSLGQTPFTKLQCLSLPLLQKAFPNQDFHKQHSQRLKVQP